MSNSNQILVVGGYGVVGKRVAVQLAQWYPGRVIVAGRNERRAAAACLDVRGGSTARGIDVSDAASLGPALDDVGTVIACVAQPELHLLRACIARGVAYTDIAPRLAFWQGAEKLRADAQKSGARILLGAGLCPGISNMMVQKLADSLAHLDRIETAILLSLGDEYGADSLHHVIEATAQSYSVHEDGQWRAATPFTRGKQVRFPDPLGVRTAYLFPWSDVVYYPTTVGVNTALGRFALDPPWAGRLASLLARAKIPHWLERRESPRGTRRVIDAFKRLSGGGDQFALVVSAEGAGRKASISLSGRRQADATAAGASELARALIEGAVAEPGVWLPEQVISHEQFFARLSSLGFNLQIGR